MWTWIMAGLIGAWLASPAHAEAESEQHLQSAVAIDEIVVIAKRRPVSKSEPDNVIVDPLKARVIRDIRQQKLLNAEFEWRIAPSLLTIESPRVRWGYDPRDDVRTAETIRLASLPLDFVQPASLVRVDF